MKKIVFGITNLSIGGAEKTLVDICNTLCDKYDITIFTIYGNGKLENKLNNKIKINHLYKKSFEELNFIKRKIISFKLLFYKKSIYKKYIKNNNYDVEISFLEGPVTRLFSVVNNNVKKIAWVHTDISLIFGSGLKGKLNKLINKNIYNNFNNLVFVSQNSLNKFEKVYNITVSKEVINNYIDVNRIIDLSNEQINFEYDKLIPCFLTVCRLVEPKAIDRLIRIHYKLIKNGFKHKIYVIGDGPQKKYLNNLINELNVQDSFVLLGEIENPYPYIKLCDYFCLLSYYEGFPMVLLEAKILNKYILVTNNSSTETLEDYSLKDVFDNSENGIYAGFAKIISKGESQGSILDNNNINNNNTDVLNKIIKLLGD